MKIGVMFGSPETTTGGNALKFYSSVRLDIRRIGAIKETSPVAGKDPTVIGNRTRVKVVKNKLAPPFREVEFDILYGQGISRSGDIVDLASEMNIVEKSGSWFSYEGERIGQGRENARAYLEARPELMEKLEGLILAKHNIKRTMTPIVSETQKAAPPPAVEKPEKTNGEAGKKVPHLPAKPAN
jgi:recombination protein RecA